MKCKICSRDDTAEVDRMILDGFVSQRDVAKHVGCSAACVSRHKKNHILPDLAIQLSKGEFDPAIDILSELRKQFGMVKRKRDLADGTGNIPVFLSLAAESRRDLELYAKLIFIIEEHGDVDLVGSDEWARLRTTIMDALIPFPEARLAVVSALMESAGEP